MPSKKSRKPKAREEREVSNGSESYELRGWIVFFAALLLLLSLLSFAYGKGGPNVVGVLGNTLGWFFHAIFGIGSYFIVIFIGWIGWQLLWHKPINRIVYKTANVVLLVVSLGMLLSLIEDQFPTVGLFLGNTLYPGLWKRKLRYHLGGAPLYYLYRDLPTFNMHRIFNTVGLFLIFSSLLMSSILYLTKIKFKQVIHALKVLFEALMAPFKVAPRQEEELDEVANSDENTLLPYSSSSRLVKVKIPGNVPSAENVTASLMKQEHITIRPETNLTERPSLSRKEKETKTVSHKSPPAAVPPPPYPLQEFTQAEEEPPKPTAPKKSAGTKKRSAPKHSGEYGSYRIPTNNLLSNPKKIDQSSLKRDLRRQAEVLEETLLSFGIEAKVGQINCGPTITSFEVHPAIGVKVQKIKSLESDIALNMEAKSIRILAPIPGKAAIGIEVPNPQPQEVSFKDMLQVYQQSNLQFRIPLLLGKTVTGDCVMHDLTKMPHCIIAGATGSGKSVCINTIVMSILLNARPDEIKLLMVDPKKVELTPYTELPHMLAPVITEPVGACAALHWLVKEMENRYDILKHVGVRNLEAFNSRTVNKDFEAGLDRDIPERLPYIVCIIDELADLMMVSNNNIETYIARIAQMARAIGIHMILATQRPSREVITGLIKANFPTRISFKVASRVNSQIVLDEVGAESLLGNGDMLFLGPGSSHTIRAQGAFIRDEDIHSVVNSIKAQAPANYVIESFDDMENPEENEEKDNSDFGKDPLYEQAVSVVKSTGNASTTFLQRKLKIGYARAASLIDLLEAKNIVGPAEGGKPRKVFSNESTSLKRSDEDE